MFCGCLVGFTFKCFVLVVKNSWGHNVCVLCFPMNYMIFLLFYFLLEHCVFSLQLPFVNIVLLYNCWHENMLRSFTLVPHPCWCTCSCGKGLEYFLICKFWKGRWRGRSIWVRSNSSNLIINLLIRKKIYIYMYIMKNHKYLCWFFLYSYYTNSCYIIYF